MEEALPEEEISEEEELSPTDLSHFAFLDSFLLPMEEEQSETMEKAHWANHGMFGCDFIEENVRFDGQHMELWLTDAPEDSRYEYPYSGAEFRSAKAYGYGYYEVRMKPAGNPGIVSSFFTYTREDDGSDWDEIDIEFLGKDTHSVQLNYYADGVGKHEYIHELGFDYTEAYHDYGFLWLEGYVAWFVDGAKVYECEGGDTEQLDHPGRIMMNLWNGTNTSKTLQWLGEYDGTVGLHSGYEAFVYIPARATAEERASAGNESLAEDGTISEEEPSAGGDTSVGYVDPTK